MSNTEQTGERDQFVERLLEATSGVFDIFTIYIGDQLGLYRELSRNGPVTSVQPAARTNTDERYIREWLEQAPLCAKARCAAMPRRLDIVMSKS